jgi:tetratricopeptide (TPR) repeat protein
MLSAYRDGANTAQVFQKVLGTTPERFDAAFDAYLKERFGDRLAIVDPFRPGGGRAGGGTSRDTPMRAGDGKFANAMRSGVAALSAGRDAEATRRFEEAKAMFPEYTADESAYWDRGRLALKRGDTTAAIAELRPIVDSNEIQYEAHILLSTLLERRKDMAGAARVLELAMYIAPGSAATHERLASMYATLGEWPKAVRERRAVVALAPADRAEAFYQLALALHSGGDDAGARRAVLQSLEVAPNFERAQKLLLELHRSAPSGAREVRVP